MRDSLSWIDAERAIAPRLRRGGVERCANSPGHPYGGTDVPVYNASSDRARPVSLRLRVGRLYTELSGRSGRLFAELLGEQVAATLDGAELVRRGTTKRHPPSSGDVRDEIGEIEHRGDEARARLVEQLSRSLVTPIDREDLFRLSRSIDDVLDHLRDFAREVDMYDVEDRRFAKPIVKALIEGIDGLAVAVEALAGDPAAITDATLAARKSAGSVRRLYQEALSKLFTSKIDGEALKQWELLHRLDMVGASLGEAVDALADGAVKRQQ